MWLLDGAVIALEQNTNVGLTFEQTNVGNRTLEYVGYLGNNPHILATLSLCILPSTKPGKI
jgi:hypothetical protein